MATRRCKARGDPRKGADAKQKHHQQAEFQGVKDEACEANLVQDTERLTSDDLDGLTEIIDSWVESLGRCDRKMLALLLVYCNRDRGVMETCKRAATVIMSGNTEVVRRWVKSALQGESAAEYDNDEFIRSHHPGVRWLLDEEPELQVEVKQWVREHGCVKGVPNMTARRFADYINSDIIQRISTGRKAPIHEDTARRWLHLLGFSKVQYQKGTFYDGHERADVVEARRIFLDELDRRVTVLEKTSTRRFRKTQIRVYSAPTHNWPSRHASSKEREI